MLLARDNAIQMLESMAFRSICRAVSISKDMQSLCALYNAIFTIQRRAIQRGEPAQVGALTSLDLQTLQGAIRQRQDLLDAQRQQQVQQHFLGFTEGAYALQEQTHGTPKSPRLSPKTISAGSTPSGASGGRRRRKRRRLPAGE